MKRWKRNVCFAMMLFLLIGCSVSGLKSSEPGNVFQKEVGTLSGVSMEIKAGTASASGATIVLLNDTERTYSYDAGFDLQTIVDGEWYSMTYITDRFGFPALESFLEPGQIEEEIDWAVPYGEMNPGTYRIVKTVYQTNRSSHFVAAEFTIS